MKPRAALPPLDRLRALEAVVREGSFKAAAVELHITPSAVSHRIAALEAQLGAPLFDRVGTRVEPTAAGTELAAVLSSAFRLIGKQWEDMTDRREVAPIRISSAPLFASRYILSGLADFRIANPQIAIELEGSHARADLNAGDCDIAIRLAAAADPAFHCKPLLQVDTAIVCSPSFWSARHEAQLFELIMQGPLLAITHMRAAWADAASVMRCQIGADTPILWFDSLDAILRQTEAGTGLALIPRELIQDALAQGGLIALSPPGVLRSPTYWLLTRKGRRSDPAVDKVVRWIMRNVAFTLGG